jgi:hypothetical protein
MVARAIHKILAGGLALAILAILSATPAGAVAHDLEHAGHHLASMHGTGLCAWMCAAGQVLASGGIHLGNDLGPVRQAGVAPCLEPGTVSPLSFTIRGPPLPLV